MIPELLQYTLLVTFLSAVVAALVPGKLSRFLALAASAVAAALAIWAVVIGHGATVSMPILSLPWLEGHLQGPILGFLMDPLSSILLIVVTVIGCLTILFSTGYVSTRNREHAIGERDEKRYYFWLLLFLGSMVGVAISPNFLQLFIFWEMTTMCSWGLISFYQNEASLKAGFKALIMTHIGGLFFLTAILLVFAWQGSFEFSALAKLPVGVRTVVFVFFMIAAWAKAAQIPLHTWLPDAMEAPTPISAYLHAAAMVKAGVYLMARSASSGWAMHPALGYVMGGMALLTILVALSFYFVQDDLKRLLAYSTIAHLGFVLLGVALGALGSIEGFRGGVLHIICHGFSKATLFLCTGAIAFATGTRSISALGGLGRRMPLVAAAFFIGVLAVAGIPPFACFWSKFMVLEGAMRLPGAVGPIVLVILLSETLVSFGWMLYVAEKVFLGKPSPSAQVKSALPPAMSLALVILMIGCLVAPIVGLPLVQLIVR